MAKIQSKEAYYERLGNLANVHSKKTQARHELGTLMDYKKGANGINYGIIKENQNYFIKKAGTKVNPDVSDFLYINGQANIKDYQYKSLGEADKNRNMMLIMLTEAEEGMGVEPETDVDAAVEKLDDLDAAAAATDKEEMQGGLESEPPAVDADPEADLAIEPETSPEGGEEMPDLGGDPEGGEEMPAVDAEPEGGEEIPDLGADPEGGEESEELRELKKDAGKVIEELRGTELTEPDVKYFVNSFLSAFEDKFQEVEIEDRKEMANKILKVVPDDEHAQLGDDMEADPNVDETDLEGVEGEETKANPFLEYMSSRGYDSSDSVREADPDEMTNAVSGYANDYVDGNNEGGFEDVALIIKVINPQMADSLKNDYGHEDYVEKLQPSIDSIEGSDEENDEKLNELFGGLKNLGKAAMGGIKKVANKVGDKVGQAATAVSQTYHSGELEGERKKLEKFAINLGQQISALSRRLEKAGEDPLNINGIIAGLKDKIMKGVDGTMEEMSDPANIETQPNLVDNITEEEEILDDKSDVETPDVETPDMDTTGLEDVMDTKVDDTEIEAPEDETSVGIDTAELGKGMDTTGIKRGVNFAPPADTLGVVGANTDVNASVDNGDANVNVDVDATNKTVNIQMNESEAKVRKYINRRLKEKTGLVKPSINENKKSKKMIELDNMIDKLFEHYKKK